MGNDKDTINTRYLFATMFYIMGTIGITFGVGDYYGDEVGVIAGGIMCVILAIAYFVVSLFNE